MVRSVQALIAFWSLALAAIAFASILVWRATRPGKRPGQALLLAALALTACWAWLGAIEPGSALARHAESARNLLWIGLLYALSSAGEGRLRGAGLVYGAVAAVLGLQFVITFLIGQGGSPALLASSEILSIIAAAGSLILVHNVYAQAAPDTRSELRFTMAGLAAIWLYDLNFYTVEYLGDGRRLEDWRGVVVLAAAPLFALGARDDRGGRIRLSRSASFQSLSILAICAYFALMVVLSTALRDSPYDWLSIATVAILASMTVAAMVVVPSARARGWVKAFLARHLFEHRYDYRLEWLRFSETLGRSEDGSAPLNERIIKAFADIFEVERGLLLTNDGSAVSVSASLDWPALPPANRLGDSRRFWSNMEGAARILELDAIRAGFAPTSYLAIGTPQWMVDDASIWIAIPLIHEARLVGIVLLAAPEHRRPLDWEDFDLLKTAGRQAASSLADALGQEALAMAQRFEEFNRRFAFILHDIKNLVSQMSLLAHNAERHADNPEFLVDMVATLKSSAGRMSDLLARLAPQGSPKVESISAQPLRAIITDAIAASRGDRQVELSGDCGSWAQIDPVALDRVLRNLIQNALEASPLVEPVHVRVSRSGGDQISIAITDQGCGMDSDFIRNRLFQPFASTKSNGFGIGAFEARSLVGAMGGRLIVDSKPGRGTTFTILIKAAEPAHDAQRKIA